jgi:hypothetical protein
MARGKHHQVLCNGRRYSEGMKTRETLRDEVLAILSTQSPEDQAWIGSRLRAEFGEPTAVTPDVTEPPVRYAAEVADLLQGIHVGLLGPAMADQRAVWDALAGLAREVLRGERDDDVTPAVTDAVDDDTDLVKALRAQIESLTGQLDNYRRQYGPFTPERPCACGCGQPVSSPRPEARYATAACRVRAHRARP